MCCCETFPSSGCFLVSFSTVIMHKSGKGRPPPARRNTVDDNNSLITCVENGEFTAKISSGESASVIRQLEAAH